MEFSSKEKVKCTDCDKKMRKDMIERHWKRNHGAELKAGIKPGWVRVPVRGQNFLSKYGFSTSKLEVVDQVTVEGFQVSAS